MKKPGMIITGGFYSRLFVLILIAAFCFQTNANAQNISLGEHYWSNSTEATAQSRVKPQIQTKSARALNLKFESFKNQAKVIGSVKSVLTEGAVISLPLPDGTFARYRVGESPIMADELASKFPQIKTYAGQGINDPSATIRFDITPKGFHAMIIGKENVIYIDPAYAGNTTEYISYYKRDYIRDGMGFSEKSDFHTGRKKKPHQAKKSARSIGSRAFGSELRTYRLAVAATGEYTDFHGGSVADGLAAITTTINRVNGIYEREVSIRMEIIGDNDQIIYTNAASDPYTNNNPVLLLDENQTNLNNVIGAANYDIGHVFSTASGGLAWVGGICDDNFKAEGTTGTATPIGDPFDVDFVAHEIGHQFGAEHTFNGTAGNCNAQTRTALSSYEPGSGTTIMGYAGICAPQNIQANSNDYFHTISYDQIVEFITNGVGSSCGSLSATGNTPPTVEAGDDYFIPVNTPFTLMGSGNDPDGDPLTYCWEQFDLGPAGPPNDPNTTGPLFRSFTPVNSPSRTFPQLSDILSDTARLGEILPAIERTMEFRLTVRDNQSGGGGVNYDNMTVNVVDVPSQFELTNFNQPATIQSGFPENITWEVANTNVSPINTQLVNIRLSLDGGLTFPVLLAENVNNDGLETVIFPGNITNQARIKIEAVDNIYFDINDSNFSIELPPTPGFGIIIDPVSTAICIPADVQFTIEVISVLGFSDPVNFNVNNLPAGLQANFSDNPVTPGNSSTLTITNTVDATPGDYTIEVVASSGSLSKPNNLDLSILSTISTGPDLVSPSDGATDIPLVPLMTWNDDPETDKYTFELATDADFNNIVDSVYDLTDALYQLQMPLESNVTYFWRVLGSNTCGAGEYSETFSFTTLIINYFTFESTDVPKTIDEIFPNTVTSTLEIQISGDMIISDVNVINLQGEHTFFNDLKVTLKSPAGTEVVLFDNICFGATDIFDLSLDDNAPNTTFDCPPVTKEVYRPEESLSAFNTENAKGTWTLIVEDLASQDGGVLNSWGLEIGTRESSPIPPINLEASPQSVNAIALTWEDASNNEDNFIVERSTFNNLNFEQVTTLIANSQSFTDEGLIPETNYVYRIKAVNDFGESVSAEVETATLPVAPADLVATVLSINRINLSWSDLSSTEDGYVIEQSEGDNQNFAVIQETEANTENYVATGLEENTTYFFRVYAQNNFGQSAFSEEVSATTLVLGIDDEIAENISVFPNPTENSIIVKVDQGGILIEGVRLKDIHGKSVQFLSAHEVKNHGNPLTLDMSTQTQGLYLLEIVTDQATVIKKIMKK